MGELYSIDDGEASDFCSRGLVGYETLTHGVDDLLDDKF